MVTIVMGRTSKILVGRQCSTVSARDQLIFLLASNETVSSNNENVSNNIETKCLLNSSTNNSLEDITHPQSRNHNSLHLNEVVQLLLATQRTRHLRMQVNYSIQTLDHNNSMNIKQSFVDETMSASDRDKRGWKRKLETGT